MEKGVSLAILLFSAIGVFALNIHYRNNTDDDAYMSDCPTPCVCKEFEGVPSVFCNGSGLAEVPKGIPVDTQFLDISNNSIKQIQRGVLDGLTELKKIYMRQNGFYDNSIHVGALDVPNLETVDLSLNKFTLIPKFLPASLKNLFITFNNLSELTDNSFVLLSKLVYLDLSNNYLSRIEPLTFAPLEYIETIFFLYNKLTDDSFPPHMFLGNNNLKMVMFCFNQIENMIENLPSSVMMLGYVGNRLTRIPAGAFSQLPNLENIEIWENQITEIEDSAFSGLQYLNRLNLMANQLTSITNETFAGLPNLQHLRLDFNGISDIQTGALKPLPQLRGLWLNTNQMSTMDPGLLSDEFIPSLCELHIKGNPWQCDCHLRWLKEKTMNASFTVPNTQFIVCAGPPNVAGKSWAQLKPSDFVCS